MNITQLKDIANKNYELIKARRRELYHFAKDNGFSPREAQILSGQSKKTILRLIKERDNA